jgi:hypothetical protein
MLALAVRVDRHLLDEHVDRIRHQLIVGRRCSATG